MSDQVRELLHPDGKSHFADWFATLDAMAAAKVRVATIRMEQGAICPMWSGSAVLVNTRLTGVRVIESIWQRTG